MLTPLLAWEALNHLPQDIAGVLKVLFPGLVALRPMIPITPVPLMAALLATAILAIRLAVLPPHPRVAETSETIHLGMVVMPENLEGATGGHKIRALLQSGQQRQIPVFGLNFSPCPCHFYQLLVPTPTYRLALCFMLSTLSPCSNYLTGCTRHVSNIAMLML
jgi:hypothetical protein